MGFPVRPLDQRWRGIAGGIDRFWLDGALRISALQQIDFLARLNRRELPFGETAVAAVLELMVVEQTPDAVLRAKTGLTGRVTPGVGWYVGLVTRGPDTWYFALNLAIPQPDAAQAVVPARKQVALAILRSEGIY